MKLLCTIVMTLCFAAVAWSQAAAEHASVASASSTGTAVTNGAGKSIGAVFESLNKTAGKINKTGGGSSSTRHQAGNTAHASNQPAPFERVTATPMEKSKQLCEATVGMDRDQLINRCGEPSMSTSQLRDAQFVEQYWYDGPRGQVIEMHLRDGKVTLVTPKAPQLPAK